MRHRELTKNKQKKREEFDGPAVRPDENVGEERCEGPSAQTPADTERENAEIVVRRFMGDFLSQGLHQQERFHIRFGRSVHGHKGAHDRLGQRSPNAGFFFRLVVKF
ncbi:hypothetical protein O181_020587 [Austropuccinia psidii MF-1]|uniref:Uncharacterized protein n=1 Tax=Austropuccinia psidii MF-1 TaxID=1389203 RepID=A0A9Q3CDS3_9BASI|nr:hypothetical protein [Austropuccinia psidii MF-1]